MFKTVILSTHSRPDQSGGSVLVEQAIPKAAGVLVLAPCGERLCQFSIDNTISHISELNAIFSNFSANSIIIPLMHLNRCVRCPRCLLELVRL